MMSPLRNFSTYGNELHELVRQVEFALVIHLLQSILNIRRFYRKI